jgi:hypothetical protein
VATRNRSPRDIFADLHAQFDGGTRGRAFGQQHGDDAACRAIAEKLAERFFMPGDAVSLHKIQEIARRVTRQGRAAEMFVRGIEFVRHAMQIGKIAAPAARNQDFLASLPRMVQHQHAAATARRGDRAHQPGRTCTQDQNICVLHGHPRLRAGAAEARWFVTFSGPHVTHAGRHSPMLNSGTAVC